MGVEMAFEMVVEDAADPARDAAVGKPEIFVGPFGKAWIEGRVVGGAGGAQPRVECVGILLIGDRGIEGGATRRTRKDRVSSMQFSGCLK
jgi:hypothetical protein